MIDKTTEGYVVTPDEIEGMVRNLCAYALSEPDPLQRYLDLTHQQVLFDGVVAAIRRERGKALADMMTMGAPVAKVAEVTNLETPQKVKSLITAAGVPVPTQKPVKAKRGAVVPAQRRSPESAAGARPAPETGPARDVRSADRDVVSVAESGPIRRPAEPAVLPQTVAVNAERTLTAAERAALGLPATGPIPQRFSRRVTAPGKRQSTAV